MKPNIITVSGPSAVGKSFFIEKITEKFPNIKEIVGITTRAKREGEIDGKSGHFMTIAELEQLERAGELMLIKEFFGNKYAWYKRDLVNTQELRIINISYKSIEELKRNGLNIFSIFIRPESEEKIQEMLKLRTVSNEEYEKRLKDYYESEIFLETSKQNFDWIFTNFYNEQSLEQLLGLIENTFIHEDKNSVYGMNKSIEREMLESKKIKPQIQSEIKLGWKHEQDEEER